MANEWNGMGRDWTGTVWGGQAQRYKRMSRSRRARLFPFLPIDSVPVNPCHAVVFICRCSCRQSVGRPEEDHRHCGRRSSLSLSPSLGHCDCQLAEILQEEAVAGSQCNRQSAEQHRLFLDPVSLSSCFRASRPADRCSWTKRDRQASKHPPCSTVHPGRLPCASGFQRYQTRPASTS
jgi:hypothetical protein